MVLALFFVGSSAFAGSFINTMGSDGPVAISGFDTVAFWVDKKPVAGKPEYAFEWMGAKWLFSTQSNMALFKSDPEEYAPQYGGHCTWGISENAISSKAFAGVFEIVNCKLCLFAPGNRAPDSARTSFWQTGGGPSRRIPNTEKYWPQLKTKLEAR